MSARALHGCARPYRTADRGPASRPRQDQAALVWTLLESDADSDARVSIKLSNYNQILFRLITTLFPQRLDFSLCQPALAYKKRQSSKVVIQARSKIQRRNPGADFATISIREMRNAKMHSAASPRQFKDRVLLLTAF
jgi:hypothetical protein